MTKKKKDEIIAELKEENQRLSYEVLALENDLESLEEDYHRVVTQPKKRAPRFPSVKDVKNHRPKYAGDVAFDFWPLRDWFRLSVKGWNPGRYAQIVIGPIRVEFFQS